jgi:hypothetical protein
LAAVETKKQKKYYEIKIAPFTSTTTINNHRATRDGKQQSKVIPASHYSFRFT